MILFVSKSDFQTGFDAKLMHDWSRLILVLVAWLIKTNSCLVTIRDICKYRNKCRSILKTVTYVTLWSCGCHGFVGCAVGEWFSQPLLESWWGGSGVATMGMGGSTGQDQELVLEMGMMHYYLVLPGHVHLPPTSKSKMSYFFSQLLFLIHSSSQFRSVTFKTQ